MPWDFRQNGKSSKSPASPAKSNKLPKVSTPAYDYDCKDFRTQSEAQKVLNSTTGDPYKLDRDKNGIACESLP